MDKQGRSIGSSDIKKLFHFIEEFGWLMSSYSSLDLQSVAKEVRDQLSQNDSSNVEAVSNYVSSNPNKHFLVGVLPRLLIDESLFVTNEDIANFALSVMDVNIPHYHKKSKFELIGHIVCKTNNLDDVALTKLVRALAVLTEKGDEARSLIKRRKNENFGWNAIIQELASNQ
jgi:hypothetical protein